jgi:WD40 repeat protein
VPNWTQLFRLKLDSSPIRSLSFSPDGELLASASKSGAIRIWQVADGRLLVDVAHITAVNSVDFSPDGHLLAAGFQNGQVVISRFTHFPTAGLIDQAQFTAQKSAVLKLAFSPNDCWLATSGEDGKIRLWRTQDWTMQSEFDGHSMAVTGLAFSPDSGILASASQDENVILWRVSDGSQLRRLTDNKAGVWDVAFSRDGNWLASAAQDGQVLLWQIQP